ncbi:transglutaminase domain-containing protein [Paenibacillus sp. N3.4]|uniref:DUF4129 domain-containing transglutaminase family protein n=1 Tax=Paenibacillus sp. N3.4 TaxID=2603222 RepID=UPI0011CB8D72|nr:transglutaminase domain-containing protein [Paenibacillus sp. N3.4]TXK75396.1 hypothetical protein FU659_27665 [Paenibacillus sp. N3.4]
MQPLESQRTQYPVSPSAHLRSAEHAAAHAAKTQSLRPAPETYFRDLIISLLLFLLVSEWIRPLAWLADDTIQVGPFLFVFAISIAIDGFKVPSGWGWTAKGLMIVLFIGIMFDRAGFATGGWIIDLIQVLYGDVIHLCQAHFDLVSGQMRTLLFLLGWTLLIAVVQALMLQRQHSLLFVAATLTYLVCLQLLLGIDTIQGVMRTLGYGLFLLSLLHLSRIQHRYGFTTVRPDRSIQWILISVVVVGMLAGLGWYSAKQTASSPMMKPVSWGYLSDRLFELYHDEQADHASAAKSGYGSDDSSLGGPLQVDSTPVFTAKSTELTYWRGESKNFYDGKGWTSTEQTADAFVPSSPPMKGPSITQEILWSDKSPNKQLFMGGNLLHVDILLTEKGKPIESELLITSPMTGKVSLPEIMDPLSYYKIVVQPVREDPVLLRSDLSEYPADIRGDYLQLPAALPRAVRGLAEQVTAGSETPYDKAVAVEQYLRNTYTYSLEKPTHPSRSEDFVSHFLLVDKAGYCNHFSTAMVVMLRSVGVPARWVKGFAQGTPQTTDEEGLKEVTVRNQDAHSWVEVYFPSVGWVSFEPTPGFSNLGLDHAEASLTTAEMAKSAMTASLAAIPAVKNAGFDPLEWLQTIMQTINDRLIPLRQTLIIGAGCCLFCTGLILVLRQKGVLHLLYMPLHQRLAVQANPMAMFMDRLWLQLFRKYGAKPAHQTVRDYVTALRFHSHAQKQALLEFAIIYESVRYDAPNQSSFTKREIIALWKAILSKP